jgi:flagellar FliJ protein
MARGFGLAGLLRVRGIQEDRAAASLADAHRLERAAHQRAARTAELLGSTVPPDSVEPATWYAAISARLAMSALLVEQTGVEQAAEQATATATEEWTAARRRTRSVERLAERHERAARQAEDRAEQLVLDEVASRRPIAGPS